MEKVLDCLKFKYLNLRADKLLANYDNEAWLS